MGLLNFNRALVYCVRKLSWQALQLAAVGPKAAFSASTLPILAAAANTNEARVFIGCLSWVIDFQTRPNIRSVLVIKSSVTAAKTKRLAGTLRAPRNLPVFEATCVPK